MKKHFLLFALACGLAVVSTSEVQGDPIIASAVMVPVVSILLTTAGVSYLAAGGLFGRQVTLWKELHTADKVIVATGLTLLTVSMISLACVIAGVGSVAFPLFMASLGILIA